MSGRKNPYFQTEAGSYDAMGRMLTRSYQDDADSSKIHTEKFTYGPGGEIGSSGIIMDKWPEKD